jgi:hypothetical protein
MNDMSDADSVVSLGNALAAWQYHLPESYQRIVDESGSSNPQIFMAHAVVSCAKIVLHFPRSTLPLRVSTATQIACIDLHARQALPESSVHNIQSIAASMEIARLASLPRREALDSPFYTCCLVLASIVQLASATSQIGLCDGNFPRHRDTIALLLGVLSQHSRKWPIARIAHEKLSVIATSLFDAHLACDSADDEVSQTISVQDSAVDLDIDLEQDSQNSWLDFLKEDMLQPEVAMDDVMLHNLDPLNAINT